MWNPFRNKLVDTFLLWTAPDRERESVEVWPVMMGDRKLHHGKQWSFDNDNPGDELGDRGDPPLTAVKPHYRVGEAKGIWHFQEL